MQPKFPAMQVPSGTDFDPDTNPNGGGGPAPQSLRVPVNRKGGTGHPGQPPAPGARAPMSGGRGSTGNPANRGGTPTHFKPHRRVPGHGGSPNQRGSASNQQRGGFRVSGQRNVPSMGHSTPPFSSSPNGAARQKIVGRFKKSSNGGSGGSGGGYGGSPVTLAT